MKPFNLEDIINKVKAIEETKLETEKNGEYKGDERILSLKKNCTYTVRLLPNVNDVDNTFVSYKEIAFTSRVDGKFVYGGRSPSDAGIKTDLFKTTQWSHYEKANKEGDDAEKKASYTLIPKRKQMVNAYLISVDGDDAEGKEKVGKVVVLRYSAQIDKTGSPVSDIYKRIHSAVFGEFSKKIGTKAFDLSEKGKSLIIKVTEKAGYNNYSETMFDDAEDIGLKPDRIVEILSQTHNLQEFVPAVHTPEEIKNILDKHWHGMSASMDDELDDEEEVPVQRPEKTVTKPQIVRQHVKEDNDEIPMGNSSNEVDELDDLLKDV